MNADTVEFQLDTFQMELKAALATRCNLSIEDVDNITTMMRESKLSFAQSALELGYVTQDDVMAATAGIHQSGTHDSDAHESRLHDSSSNLTHSDIRALHVDDDTGGLIQAAIGKISQDRQVVVRFSDTIQAGPQMIQAHDPYNPRSERIRALRTELLLRNEARQTNIVCVASSAPAEGRSQLAGELAIAFSQLGRRTLLIDADLRHPQQHVLFPASNDRGLSDSLVRGDRPYVYSVQDLPHLSLLTSGPLPPNPLELISSGRFERLMQDFRKDYEFVVIDTPPITRCADALAIATFARRVLFVVRAERTRYRDTHETLRRLSTTRAQILGTALNHF